MLTKREKDILKAIINSIDKKSSIKIKVKEIVYIPNKISVISKM